MSCALTKGFTKDCRDAVGGIKSMWVFNKGDVTIDTEVAGAITAISGSVSDVFEYELRRENAVYNETINNSLENHTLYYGQELAFSIAKMESTKRNELKLVAGANVTVVFLDNNGVYWLIGKTFGLQLGGTAMSGTALADKNGYDLTFTGNEAEPAQEIYAGWLADLV